MSDEPPRQGIGVGVRSLWAWLSRPWRRSLRARLVASFGLVFFLALVLLLARMGQVIYTAQLEEAEHNLEIEAFLAANALEDPLSGYAVEFERHELEENDEGEWERDDPEDEADEEAEWGPRAQGLEGLLRGGRGNPGTRGTMGNGDRPGPARPDGRLQYVAESFAQDLDARVTILDARGHPLADSHYPPHQIPNQFHQTEIQAALRGTEQHDVRRDPLSGEWTIFAAAPIQQGSRILGLVQLSQPLDRVVSHTQQLVSSLLFTGLAALLLMTVLGLWMSRQLVEPVRRLEQAALAMAAGDLEQRVQIDAEDELGALARAFNYMAARLQDTLERQRLFVANASHELRTPLTNIKLRSEALVNESVPDPAMAQRYLAEIDREADRLTRLANTLLDLSRLESTDPPPPSKPVHPVQILRAMVPGMTARAQAKGVAFQATLAEDTPPVQVWPEQLEAIVVNLVDNAIKYTPEGGQVALSTGEADGRCRIQIADTGVGIPPEDLPHIFDRFYRVDKARSRQEAGSGWGSGAGLGLYIAKTLVEQNGGHIRVESTPGQGTTFTVEFPAAEWPPGPGPSSTGPQAGPVRRGGSRR